MYVARFGFLHTAADAATESIFFMRNPTATTKKILVQKVILNVGFDDTTAIDVVKAAYGLTRITTANMTGGSSPERIRLSTKFAASVVPDAGIKTGALLTDTSVVYEGNFHEFASPATNAAIMTQTILFDTMPFSLFAGEGIALRLVDAASVRQFCFGSIWWKEEAL